MAGALTAALLLTVSGCAGGESGGSADDGGDVVNLNVGMVDSLTGPIALYGQGSVCAAQILTDAINNDDFVPGVKVNLTVIDDQSVPANAVQAATKLTNEGNKFILGGTTSPLVAPRIPITNDAGALDTLGLSQGRELVESAELAVHPGPIGPQNGAAVAALLEDLDARSVVFLAGDTDYGKSSVQGVKDALDPGVEVLDEILVPATQVDFANTVTQVTAQQPDYVVMFVSGAAGVLDFFTRMDASGTATNIVVGPGTLSQDIATAAGAAAEGIHSVDTYPPATSGEADKGMIANFEKYSADHDVCRDKALGPGVSTTYAGLLLIAQAAARTGSDDPATVRAEIIANEWDVPAGTATFDEFGQGDPNFTSLVVENGVVTPVGS